ncbi:MAG: outer membrane lipoprotein-sorting protein [Candidatus Omnitrophica bacterium]|nr:outer membrane lipoprotein-sorting protein [Candidatus Omnitrophota bacterium]
MRNLFVGVIIAFCVLLAYRQSFAEAPSGASIIEKSFNRDDGKDSYSKIEMTLVDKQNNLRSRILEIYSKDFGDLTKTFLEFSKPADIKDTRFLSIEEKNADNTQYLYLPALGRARRIVSSQKNLAFVNTDYTYEDMQRRRPEKDAHKLIAEESLDGHSCFVVESIPRDGASQYSKRISWIDKESYLVLRVDFYDKKVQKTKELRVKNFEIKQGIWTITQVEMENLKDQHKTLMKLLEINYNQGLVDDLFTVYRLEKQ